MKTKIKTIGANSACFALGLLMAVVITKFDMIRLDSLSIARTVNTFGQIFLPTGNATGKTIASMSMSIDQESRSQAEKFERAQLQSPMTSPKDISDGAWNALSGLLSASKNLVEGGMDNSPAVASALKAPVRQYALFGSLFSINIERNIEQVKASQLLSFLLLIGASFITLVGAHHVVCWVQKVARQGKPLTQPNGMTENSLWDWGSKSGNQFSGLTHPKQSLFWPIIN